MTRALPFVLLALLAGAAQAQTMVCGKRDVIVADLENKYGETRRAVMMQGSVFVVEVYASEKTGSWSILRTNTAGMSCLIAAGTSYEVIPQKPVEEGT